MCLSVITGQGAEVPERGFGYKIMRRRKKGDYLNLAWASGIASRGGLFATLRHSLREGGKLIPYAKNVWYDANTEQMALYVGDGGYRLDFHIYTNKPPSWMHGVESWVLVKVEYDGAHTIGTQVGRRIVVAKYMRIVEVLK